MQNFIRKMSFDVRVCWF